MKNLGLLCLKEQRGYKLEEVKGYIDHIVYRNNENGYSVLVVLEEGEEITLVGTFQTIDQGENILAKGEYIDHQVYGRQLKVESYEIVPPDDIVSMERYLGSGAVKGIGATLATRIIKKFGEDTFRIIEEEPERLAEIKGISTRIAREIAMQMEDKKDMREVMIFLQQYGITNSLAVKIYEKYHGKIYSIMQENPYQLAEDINGVGFKIADEIASKIGIHTDSDFRIRSGILYVLLQASNEGNIYLPKSILLDKASQLLEIQAEDIEPQIGNLSMDKKLVCKTQDNEIHVYSISYYYAELNCAKMLHDLNVHVIIDTEVQETQNIELMKKLKSIENSNKIELDDLQRNAVVECIRSGLFILSGGPGTGKTTTINMMIHYFELEGMDIFLAAPTGRAAKRMTEATGYEARTIHRLLELNGASLEEGRRASFEKNQENPLEVDVIIIDEMSMVDIHLFQSLLKAISVGTRLIMVGDINQLPSVGPGQILRDLIHSKMIPVAHLEKIYRQAGESDIIVNAHKINKGQQISLSNKSKDFFFLERNDVNVIYKHMIQLIQDKLPKYVNATSLDIQILTPMRKGNLGVEVLNKILQKYLNPSDKSKKEYIVGENIFRQGDKIMQIRNNYQIEWEIVSKYGIPIDRGVGVFNGDMGKILEVNEYSQTVLVEYDEHKRVTYGYTQLDELELAYAITIHKSQGSEYPAVIIPLLNGPAMLCNRNLLYTGVTRARKCVTILGRSEMIQSMIANDNQQKRYTSLDVRMNELREISH